MQLDFVEEMNELLLKEKQNKTKAYL